MTVSSCASTSTSITITSTSTTTDYNDYYGHYDYYDCSYNSYSTESWLHIRKLETIAKCLSARQGTSWVPAKAWPTQKIWWCRPGSASKSAAVEHIAWIDGLEMLEISEQLGARYNKTQQKPGVGNWGWKECPQQNHGFDLAFGRWCDPSNGNQREFGRSYTTRRTRKTRAKRVILTSRNSRRLLLLSPSAPSSSLVRAGPAPYLEFHHHHCTGFVILILCLCTTQSVCLRNMNFVRIKRREFTIRSTLPLLLFYFAQI